MSGNSNKTSSEITSFQHLEPGPFVIRTIQNDPTLQPSTKHQYIKAIENYLATGEKLTDPVALSEYASTVSNSTRPYLAAAVFRAQALQNTIKIQQSQGERAHTLLTRLEAEQLLKTCHPMIVNLRRIKSNTDIINSLVKIGILGLT